MLLTSHLKMEDIDLADNFIGAFYPFKDIMVDVKCAEVLYIPGVMTPTEVRACFELELYIISNLYFFEDFFFELSTYDNDRPVGHHCCMAMLFWKIGFLLLFF